MFSMMRTLAAITGTLLLAGCATAPNSPTLALDHPANPNAAESPVPARSQTLALGVQTPTPMTVAAPAPDHGGESKPGTNGGAGTRHNGLLHDHAGGAMQATNAPARPMRSGEGAAASSTAAASGHAPPATAPAAFVCPMHPQVVSVDPNATCPVCGMKINKPIPAAVEPVALPATAAAPAAYLCQMHPEVVSADPNARCPKCGMKINKRKPAAAGGARTTQPAEPAPGSVHSGHGGHEGRH